MRRWGTIITVFYGLIVAGLLIPGAFYIAGAGYFLGAYEEWLTWVPIGIVMVGEALLLFLSVDTSFQRNKPRAHILVSCLVTATLWALLTGAAIFSLGAGIYGDRVRDHFPESGVNILLCWGGVWAAWAIVFYLYFRKTSASITRVTSWLLKGSVLELLIAVPAHVIVRRRNDCSAPFVTSFGIATGIAIMLLAFGPSVLLLYKDRLDGYSKRGASAGQNR